MSTIESINRSGRVPLVQERCPTAEEVRATPKDPSNQKTTPEEKAKSLASSLLDTLKPPSSTSHPSLMRSDPTEHYMSAADAHKKNGDHLKAVECYKSAGHVYAKNGAYEKAAKCYRLAASHACMSAGDMCKKFGHSKKADRYYSLAADACLKNNELYSLRRKEK